MKKVKTFLTLILAIICWAMPSIASDTYTVTRQDHSNDVPGFGVRMFNLAADADSLSRLTIQIIVIYDELQFIKSGDQFRADFDATVAILDSTGENVIEQQKVQGEARAVDFDQTKSEIHFTSAFTEFQMTPGNYRAKIEVTDKETRRTGSQEGIVHLRDLMDGSFSVSDIMFVTSVAFLNPVSDASKENKGLFAYFEIYNVPAGDSLGLDFNILDTTGENLASGHEFVVSDGPVVRHHVEIPDSLRTLPDFAFSAKLQYGGQVREVKQGLRKTPERLGDTYANLDEAIEQLRYIAKGKDIKNMLKLEGEEKVRAFQTFWKQRDPIKETNENEMMEEYYRRVAMANREFEGLTPGWETQRGMVLIKLGPPEYVTNPQNSSFDYIGNNRLRQIWHYPYINRYVIFEVLGNEYRIANYVDVFDLLGGDSIRM